LVLGKPIGIVALTLTAAAVLKRPPPSAFAPLLGVAMVAGMGFTMSLFIGGLAFENGPEAGPVRIGVLCGSLISAAAGLALLSLTLPRSGKAKDGLGER
jgi:Na+:H+ antiporter, NhaA family